MKQVYNILRQRLYAGCISWAWDSGFGVGWQPLAVVVVLPEMPQASVEELDDIRSLQWKEISNYIESYASLGLHGNIQIFVQTWVNEVYGFSSDLDLICFPSVYKLMLDCVILRKKILDCFWVRSRIVD